ncbi:nicotinate-nucleotide adenylyltransferase [Desulfopila inferna]|uniref:nicotinate-nucleotide adenylyltransferase n=1 Tax=Desulfopila inferna TaxID=468528 RepID=UPI001965FFDA|nr:nicotinate-nucleotide adenylyltransferase [Desulfopila inferna]MBM9602772.1 nicotinate (nicotinamide) nucleotide adenylyltransferase [Desulfopila inferna]
MRATGLFGGTFDPVHVGHIELARHALEYCRLAEVVFIPAASPPHKSRKHLTAFHHRVAMLTLATEGESRFSVCEVEKDLPPPTYTVDTLNHLLQKNTCATEYYFIIGIDAFLDIHTWKEYEKVIGQVHFIVAARPGYTVSDLQECIASLHYQKKVDHWYNASSKRKIYYLELELADVSSTDIRKTAGSSTLPKDAIAPAVFKYIKDHNLYSSGR